jgi:hypothetical protein
VTATTITYIASSLCTTAVPLIHFIPYSLSYSVPPVFEATTRPDPAITPRSSRNRRMLRLQHTCRRRQARFTFKDTLSRCSSSEPNSLRHTHIGIRPGSAGCGRMVETTGAGADFGASGCRPPQASHDHATLQTTLNNLEPCSCLGAAHREQDVPRRKGVVECQLRAERAGEAAARRRAQHRRPALLWPWSGRAIKRLISIFYIHGESRMKKIY